MTDPTLIDLGDPLRVPPAGAEESPAWMLVRATANIPGLHRDHVATVDANDPAVKQLLAHEWLVALPAAQQPQIVTDPETGEPRLAKEAPDGS